MAEQLRCGILLRYQQHAAEPPTSSPDRETQTQGEIPPQPMKSEPSKSAIERTACDRRARTQADWPCDREPRGIMAKLQLRENSRQVPPEMGSCSRSLGRWLAARIAVFRRAGPNASTPQKPS